MSRWYVPPIIRESSFNLAETTATEYQSDRPHGEACVEQSRDVRVMGETFTGANFCRRGGLSENAEILKGSSPSIVDESPSDFRICGKRS